MSTIQHLSPLQLLTKLNIGNNAIESIKDITSTLKQMPCLHEVSCIGNPVSKEHHYREEIIANCHILGNNINVNFVGDIKFPLERLDNKSVSEITRRFIKRFEEEKSNYESRSVRKLGKYMGSK